MDTKSFFFYDLETSGLSARSDRIMQFAGLRTNLDLNPLGDPVNLLVKLPDDTLPSPCAIMVTKITPQSTLPDGLTEAEFSAYLQDEIFTEGTCAVGYNNVRFDDEFMRHLFWRNFYDPYSWHWQDGRSRWDLLDVVRLTRALRPEGINWPFATKIKENPKTGEKETLNYPTNRLELLTKKNGISHEHAHDALSDVFALVAVTRLIKEKQPKLYEYLFKLRQKSEVQNLVNLENPHPFVYASGRYSAEFNKTTVAFPLAPAKNGNVLVWDLRFSPEEARAKKEASERKTLFPIVKTLQYNKCPAVAPLGVLDQADGWAKIGLEKAQVEKNLEALLSSPDLLEQARTENETDKEFKKADEPEAALYDGFLSDQDSRLVATVHEAAKNPKNAEKTLADFHPNFSDERLPELLLHYKARSFRKSLAADELEKWETYRQARLNRQAPRFLEELQKFSQDPNADDFIIEELKLWYESLG